MALNFQMYAGYREMLPISPTQEPDFTSHLPASQEEAGEAISRQDSDRLVSLAPLGPDPGPNPFRGFQSTVRSAIIVDM